MNPKEKIIERSLNLFIQHGCKSVTMDDIAKDSGVSKKTIYENFTDKNHLLEESLRALYIQMEERATQCQYNGENILDALFKMHETHLDNLLHLKKRFFDELKRYYYPIFKRVSHYFLDFQQKRTIYFIERGQKEGLIRTNINKELVCKAFIEISNAMENSKIFPMYNYSKREVFNEVIIPYIRGLSTIDGLKIIDVNIEKINKKDTL